MEPKPKIYLKYGAIIAYDNQIIERAALWHTAETTAAHHSGEEVCISRSVHRQYFLFNCLLTGMYEMSSGKLWAALQHLLMR